MVEQVKGKQAVRFGLKLKALLRYLFISIVPVVTLPVESYKTVLGFCAYFICVILLISFFCFSSPDIVQ